MIKLEEQYQRISDRAKCYLLSHKKTLWLCFISVFLWGFLAHGYGFIHNPLCHDSLNAFIATQAEELWKVEIGRFFVPIYRAVFRGPVAMSWLIGIMGLLWTAISLFLVVKVLDFHSKVLTVLTAGIMVTNITNIAQIATYIHEYDCNAFSLMLAIFAVYFWHQDKGLLSIVAGSICLMASIGLYQAFFAVTVALIVWKSIMDLLDGNDVRKVFFHGIRGIATILLGGILYLLAGKLIYHFSGITAQSRTDALNMGGQNPIVLYLKLIKPALVYLFNSIFHIAYSSKMYAISICAVSGFLALSVMHLFRKKKFTLDRILLILLLVGLMPFAMSCVFFLSKGSGMHDVTRYASWFFYIFILSLVFRLCDKDMLSDLKTYALRAAACVLVAVILWQNVVLANTAYVKREMEYNAELSTMTRVVAMLEQQEDFNPKESTVAFIGWPPSPPTIYGMENVNGILGLAYNSPIISDGSVHFYNLYKAYFTYVLQYPVNFCSDDVHVKLKADPRVLALPAYPAEGCMQMIDGTFVIKLGSQQPVPDEVDDYAFVVN